MGKLEDLYGSIRQQAVKNSRRTEAEKIIQKISFGLRQLEKEVCALDDIPTVFIANSSEPYVAYGGGSLASELMRINRLNNIFGDNKKELVELNTGALKLAGTKLVLIGEGAEKAALDIARHTEHALTVFVSHEFFQPDGKLLLLPDYFRQINKKMRRDDSENNLTKRDSPSYL